MQFVKQNLRTILIALAFILVVATLLYYVNKSEFSLEETIRIVWDRYVEDWGYIILFCWSILEGEWGLLLSGIAAHQGYLNVYWCIFIAGLGGFTGDQIYFYIGRLNKDYVQRKFKNQRRKFALASSLMRKYGWPIIFVQRYMYGLRTIIPISIGLTRYSSLKFAIINLISAWIWAAITIVPAWYFGAEILDFIQNVSYKVKENPLIFLVLLAIIACIIAFIYSFIKRNQKHKEKGHAQRNME